MENGIWFVIGQDTPEKEEIVARVRQKLTAPVFRPDFPEKNAYAHFRSYYENLESPSIGCKTHIEYEVLQRLEKPYGPFTPGEKEELDALMGRVGKVVLVELAEKTAWDTRAILLFRQALKYLPCIQVEEIKWE